MPPLAGHRMTLIRWVTRYAATTDSRMATPPIVGVPRLVWCEVGPSSRMYWP